MGYIDTLQAHRKQILFIELAGLLHDIGKLSSEFLKYRQEWQECPNGYYEDPHDNGWFGVKPASSRWGRENLPIPATFNNKIPEDGIFSSLESDFSIVKAVNKHTGKPEEIGRILKMLKAADSIDSAIDRNNPLWSAEQRDKDKLVEVFRSTVFGYETKLDEPSEGIFNNQEKEREKLYKKLNDNIGNYFNDFKYCQRKVILGYIKCTMSEGLSDTSRPQNDTTLWEHSYATASILKAITVYNLFNQDKMMLGFEDIRFGIVGIGWDGISFISSSQKIPDILGRKGVINEIKKEIKELIESKYPVGNEIYADDNGIYFLVPKEIDKTIGGDSIWYAIENEIYKKAADTSDGELQPHIEHVSDTNTLTALVTVINNLKTKWGYRFDSSIEGFKKHFQPKLVENLGKQENSICPICRLRLVESENDEKKICSICKERRKKSKNFDYAKSKEQTAFIDEIAEKEKGAALIVARFVLDDWLNGNMVRSLFVTEAHGLQEEIKELGFVKQFEDEENKIMNFLSIPPYDGEFNYQRIKDDIDALKDNRDMDRAKYTAFLYSQRVVKGSLFSARDIDETRAGWKNLLENAQKENHKINIYNVLNAKTPTASTLLDVWETTLKFFTETVSESIIDERFNDTKTRLRLTLDGDSLNKWNGTAIVKRHDNSQELEALYVNEHQVDVIGQTFTDESKDEWKNKDVTVIIEHNKPQKFRIGKPYPGTPFKPYRTLSISPNLFMAIVPASKAVEISTEIYKKYEEHFGKVMGRLPFSIGNLFFRKPMPMFVVIDAGKRMIENFDRLAKVPPLEASVNSASKKEGKCQIDFDCKIGELPRTIQWSLPYKFDKDKFDYHHPYLIVEKSDSMEKRQSYFETVAGDVVCFNEIQEGDRIKFYPNYYDFEFLDSNARRHDIRLQNSRRKSSVADFASKPILLDELDQRINRLWKQELKKIPDMTDTKLRNLQTLWLTKYQEWEIDLQKDDDKRKLWLNLVAASLNKELRSEDELLLETIKNGTFFDTLELYLGILKERINETDKEGGTQK